jgi:muramoyltetrapeptide carboxypeptidase LdcA involved in peptidoglycan recycling
MLIKQIIPFQDKLYLLKRRILDDGKHTGSNLDILMKWLDSNKVLRKDGYLFFLEEIEEAELLGYETKN